MLLLNVLPLWFIASGYMGLPNDAGIGVFWLLGIILAIKVLYELFKFLVELKFPVFVTGVFTCCLSAGAAVFLHDSHVLPGIGPAIWFMLGIMMMVAGRKR